MPTQTLQPTVTRLSLAIGLSLASLAVQAQVQLPAPAAPAAQPAASGVSGVVIRDVRVEGLQRIEPGTVFSYLPIKVGDRMSENGITESVRLLFATGFFKDVRVELEGDVLVVLLEERPAIGVVEITGSKEFDKDTLKKALADSGLAEARIFDRALLDRAEQELKRQYLGRGKYDVQIQSTITPLERNRVAVSIAIDEGEDARIKEIRIVGAKAFKEKDLLSEFKLSTPTWMSWYTKSDQYSRQKLTGDIETLKSFYLNRGHLEFVVDATQVSLSADRKDVFITLVINEGEKFNFGEVKLAGDLLGQPAQFEKLQTLKSGEVFSQEKLLAVTKAMTDRMGELGYAFANVNPLPLIDRTNKRVDFTLQLDPGRRVYVRRINISGNAKTRDEVIRREMRQFEASWYQADKISLSRTRIDRLGYFNKVDVTTAPVVGVGDQVDLDVKVEERPLGSFSLGVGFSTSEKLGFQTSLSQANFLGSGTNVAFDFNTSAVNRVIAFSHFDPYWTDDGLSRSMNFSQGKKNYGAIDNVGIYEVETFAAGFGIGVPTSESNRVLLGSSYSRERVSGSPDRTSVPGIYDFMLRYPKGAQTLALNSGYSVDNRSGGISPVSGDFYRFSVEYATPLGDLEFIVAKTQYQFFFPVSRTITYAFNVDAAAGQGLGGQSFPATKVFYAGGVNSVRSFANSTIGPKSTNGITALGGDRKITFNNEVLFPFPGMEKDRTMRLFAFIDGGNVWGDGPSGGLRLSSGVGLSWVSPVGPFKFALGKPLKKASGDGIQKFQFQIGTNF